MPAATRFCRSYGSAVSFGFAPLFGVSRTLVLGRGEVCTPSYGPRCDTSRCIDCDTVS